MKMNCLHPRPLSTLTAILLGFQPLFAGTYTVVDTGQVKCYDNSREIDPPSPGRVFHGQDAQYNGAQPAYRDNGDGTVSDLNTGLMWIEKPGDKKTFDEAVAGAGKCRVGGYSDWRLPTIKELYSLILFSGTNPSGQHDSTNGLRPFIDTNYFDFEYGNPRNGERVIDSQFATCTRYVSTTMNGAATMFGVNFADGRIKGYPSGRDPRGRTKTYYVLYVRGNPAYGENQFHANGDGTVTDRATGLTWMMVDSGHLKAGNTSDGSLNWKEALEWAERLTFAGHDDWRLPNAKELQSIVDYSRSPDTTRSPAIDPVFKCTSIVNEAGERDWAFYWTSTTHAGKYRASEAVYVAFGRALGKMRFPHMRSAEVMDVHGAGAQRSDTKSGDRSRFPISRGPQGDIVRVYNLVRCVRGGLPGDGSTLP